MNEKGDLCVKSLLPDLFQQNKSVISRHIRNVFDEGSWARQQLLQSMQQFKQREESRSRGTSSSTVWTTTSSK